MADQADDRVDEYHYEGTTVRYVGQLGGGGELGSLLSPWGVALANTTLYVADTGHSGVAKWTLAGEDLPPAYGGKLGVSDDAQLVSVSCRSEQACLAVGQKEGDLGAEPFVESWNGATWTIEPAPPTGGRPALLKSVSCRAVSECMAVGSIEAADGEVKPYAGLWRDGSWVNQAPVVPPGSDSTVLTGVSCLPTAVCIAVGDERGEGGSETGISERWTREAGGGEAWTLTTMENPFNAPYMLVMGVSCSSPVRCTAVGSDLGRQGVGAGEYWAGLVESWNGEGWSDRSPLLTGRQESLEGVSCWTDEACEAVGTYEIKRGRWVTMTDVWNGVAWSNEAAPSEIAAPDNGLTSVSCALEAFCAAIGNGGGGEPLVETHSDVQMRVDATPALAGATQASFSGVACTSATVCTAVGASKVGASGPSESLADQWNGSEWQTGSVPSAGGQELNRVSCAEQTCVAVGVATDASGAPVPLAYQLSDSIWHAIEPIARGESELSGVSCASETFCAAVGHYKQGSSGAQGLSEVWNGEHWREVEVPSPPHSTSAYLAAVACSSDELCVAVGQYTTEALGSQPLAELWDGSHWELDLPLNPTGASNAELSGVSCAGSGACLAVGQYTLEGRSVALAESLTGEGGVDPSATWSLEAAQLPAGATSSDLSSVSCTASEACAAVGSYHLATGGPVPLAELWNGFEWLDWRVPAPAGDAELADVACVSMRSCAAVGSSIDAGTRTPLAESLGAPGVSTGGATAISEGAATLTGSVAANQWSTSYYFEYGKTTEYGTTSPAAARDLMTETGEAVAQITPELEAGTAYHFRLVATSLAGTTYGADETFMTSPAVPPTVTTGTASSVESNTATLNATVNPHAARLSSCEFEYGPTTSYGSRAKCTPLPGATASAVAVSAAVTGLTDATTYHYRVVATNVAGTSFGADETFTTPLNPPTVQTKAAALIGVTSADLIGSVNPNLVEVQQCEFEYGTTAAYGTSVPCASLPGAGASAVDVSATVTGLTPNTRYHFRLSATDGGGTRVGEDRTLTTRPSTSVTNVQPNTSVEAGGARVTISGADFTGATEVKFGATKATSFAVNSAGAITAVAPPGKGTVDVTVTGPGGTSLVSTADQFIYRPGGVFTAWGSNSFGQFCNGTTSGNTGVRTPVEVSAIGAAGPTALAGGAYFSLALTKEGAVLACGENKYGQLGDESIVNSHVAVEVKGIKNASAIAAGQYFGLALVEGKVFAWGANERGQLGDGSTSRSTVPVKVEGLSEEVVSIAAGKNFAFAVLKSGKVMAWGDNTFGELGVDNEESSDLPVEVPGLGEAATAVAGGAEFGLALLKDGKVMAWGDDGLGQLGNGERPEEESQRSPVEVKELSGITAIAAGKAYGLALRSNGTAMAWGFDESGQFGDGKKTDDQDSPVELDKGLGGVTAIAAGEATSYALLKGGTVIDAGLNAYGQTGNGSGLGIVDEPVEVKELSETTAIAGGYGFAMAVGRLSSTSVTNVQPNTSVEAGGARVTISGADFTGATEVKFGATKATSFAVNSAGAITAVAPPGKGTVDVTVTGPGGTSLVSTADQFIYRSAHAYVAWGGNAYGQLGNGTTSANSGVRSPIEVKGITREEPTALAAGGSFSLALEKEGTVWAWGENKHGQLGDKTVFNKYEPVRVGTLRGASAIAAGEYFGLALVEGKVFAWGANEYGQLGDGNTNPSETPVEVTELVDRFHRGWQELCARRARQW